MATLRKAPRTSRWVASVITTVSGSASDSTRAATFGVWPRARRSRRAPEPISPTTVSPVWMPIRSERASPCSCGAPSLSLAIASTIPSPELTARSASSSWARG